MQTLATNRIARKSSPIEAVWHAVQCKARQEFTAEENLLRQRFAVYLPRMQTRKKFAGQWFDAVEPLFPGYLFINVRLSEQSVAPVRSTRGVLALVKFGDSLAVVADIVVEELRRCEDHHSHLRRDDRRDFREGEEVQIVDGRFSGMQALFLERDGNKRALVLMELFGTKNKLCMPLDWIRKAA
jgi:transcriptional antiterminator RfaH